MAIRSTVRRFFDIRNFSLREALWIALLLHLLILFAPEQFNPFNLFRVKVDAAPEPMTMTFAPPREPQTELTEQPKEQKAVTPVKRPDPPQTKQPTVKGDTNAKTFEAPPPQQQVTPRPEVQPQRVEETGDEVAQKPKEQPQTRTQADPRAAQQRSELLKRALQNQNYFKESDVPLSFNNDKSSSADAVDSMIQFDTYDWNYEPYRAAMIRKLYYYWVPKLYTISFFRLGFPGRTIYRFTIRKDGTVTAMELLDAATSKPYDLAAEYAIISPFTSMTTPFPPLPMGFPKEDLTVTIGFFVNMDVPDQEKK